MVAVLIENMIPLYILIALGYWAGRYLEVNLHSLATLAIYILSPVVIFGALITLEFSKAYLLLPIVIYLICLTISLAFYRLSSIHFKDKMSNLIGMASGTGNTGYFGLPIVMALYGQGAVGVYVLMNIGIIMYEVTFGFYIGARGNHSVKESIKKVLLLPAFHAAWLGLVFNTLSIEMPNIFYTYWEYFTGAWVVIGMMLIGISLAHVKKLHINWAMLGWMFSGRFIAWPCFIFIFVFIDYAFLGLYDKDIHSMLILIGFVPHAANTVAYASTLAINPGEAATAVLLSTLISFFLIPAVFIFLG